VIAAGESAAAQALLGRTVGVYRRRVVCRVLRCLNVMQCACPSKDGTTAEQGASCFVNPMTALGMTETMRMEGHTALVHTAAASNLGPDAQSHLSCADGIELVNIVRQAQSRRTLLREILGRSYVVNSSSDELQ
jgi:NADPH2:quinone reductase